MIKLDIQYFGGRGASSSEIRGGGGVISAAGSNELPQSVINSVKSQKALKGLASDGLARDITNLSDEQARALRKVHGGMEKVKITRGTYGMNGALLRSYQTGEYFVITSRNSNLFYWVP